MTNFSAVPTTIDSEGTWHKMNEYTSNYATGTLGQKEAAAVLATVARLESDGLIWDGMIHDWSGLTSGGYRITVQRMVNALAEQGLTLQAGGMERMIANVYADVQDTYTRDLAAQHQADAIAFDTNNGEY